MHAHRSLARALLPCALAATLGACADLRDLMDFQRVLAEEFKGTVINVNVTNGSHLTLTFVNSPQASLEDSERAAFAKGVAELVRDRYPGYSSMQTVDVAFTSRSSAGPLSVSRTGSPYRFTRAQLGERVGPKPGT